MSLYVVIDVSSSLRLCFSLRGETDPRGILVLMTSGDEHVVLEEFSGKGEQFRRAYDPGKNTLGLCLCVGGERE